VRIQNPVTKRWDSTGIIVEARNGYRSFFIKKKNGRETLRNRRYLRLIRKADKVFHSQE
jgi:hypothetical protein